MKSPDTAPASAEISAFRRTFTASWAVRLLLLIALFTGGFMLVLPVNLAIPGMALVTGSGALYFYLSWKSAKVTRDAIEAREHLSRGELDEASELLASVLRRFSFFPSPRVAALHDLSVIRAARGRHEEAAALCLTVQSSRPPPHTDTTSRLIYLECVLELGRLDAAHHALRELWGREMGVPEQARLLASRCRYEAAVGAYDHLLTDLPSKLVLLGEMPGPIAVATCLAMALAATVRGDAALARRLSGMAVCLAPTPQTLTNLTRLLPLTPHPAATAALADLEQSLAAARQRLFPPGPPS